MADEPISQLQLISTPPYSSNFTTNNPTGGTSGTGGAQLEILDTTNQTMASTGTNSRIFPGDLIMGYLAAGSNVTLTETNGIVTIASSAIGLTNVSSQLSSAFSITSQQPTFQTVTGMSVVLPVATPAKYLVSSTVRSGFFLNGAVGNSVYIVCQLYDTTNSTVIPGSLATTCMDSLQVTTATNILFEGVGTIGPYPYVPATAPATIVLQAYYYISGGNISSQSILSDSGGGWTFLNALRIS